MAETGIEVHVTNTGSVQAIGKALHAMHLDAVNHWLAKGYQAVIVIDGAVTFQPSFTKHFVACPPGEHEVAFWFHSSTMPVPDALQHALNEAKCKVTVAADKVTLLAYKLRSRTVMTSTLEVTGTR